MPEVESRVAAKSADEVLAEFDRRKDHLVDLSNATERLIRTILEEEKMPFQLVQARVKKRDKLRAKYCKSDKDYRSLDEVPDVVGLRIITYHSDKIDQIAGIIGQEFAQCGPLEDKRLGKLDSFGYSAIHMDCMHLPKRAESTEYRRFANARFEIQITTILGHAWAEMHHPWYDELNSPTEELRRFHRLAAVLELAEQEFLEIRKKKDDRERIASVRVAAKTPGTPVTSESLNALIEQNELVSELDERSAKIFGIESSTKAEASVLNAMAAFVNGVGIDTIQGLEDELKARGDAVAEFLLKRRGGQRQELKPGSTSPKGICILQLANFLASLLGADHYKALIQQAHIGLPEGTDLDQQILIAQEIEKRFRAS
jgi:putative GTP pyrophosphokinase